MRTWIWQYPLLLCLLSFCYILFFTFHLVIHVTLVYILWWVSLSSPVGVELSLFPNSASIEILLDLWRIVSQYCWFCCHLLFDFLFSTSCCGCKFSFQLYIFLYWNIYIYINKGNQLTWIAFLCNHLQPLSDARSFGHEGICKILEAHGGIDPVLYFPQNTIIWSTFYCGRIFFLLWTKRRATTVYTICSFASWISQ